MSVTAAAAAAPHTEPSSPPPLPASASQRDRERERPSLSRWIFPMFPAAAVNAEGKGKEPLGGGSSSANALIYAYYALHSGYAYALYLNAIYATLRGHFQWTRPSHSWRELVIAAPCARSSRRSRRSLLLLCVIEGSNCNSLRTNCASHWFSAIPLPYLASQQQIVQTDSSGHRDH